jgi:hypothetical protein
VIQEQYERFVKCASYSILHAHAINQHQQLHPHAIKRKHDGLGHVMANIKTLLIIN